MDYHNSDNENTLPLDYLTRRKPKIKVEDKVVAIPFTGDNLGELVQWLSEDNNKPILKEFIYGWKSYDIDEKTLKQLFSKYYHSSHVYKAIRICIKTPYDVLIPIGTAHAIIKSETDSRCILKKFYIAKNWRKSKYVKKSCAQ